MIRDMSINAETDATHMLTPMPLAISLGVGSQAVPYVMPAVENINGQAITLHVKHKGVKEAKDMKASNSACRLITPCIISCCAIISPKGGVDPDKDVQIRVVPPPEMVANLKAATSTAISRPTLSTSGPFMKKPGSSSC